MNSLSCARFLRFILAKPQAFILLAIVCLIVGGANLFNGTLLARSDFPAFYDAGRILREYGGERLYDMELQRKLDQEAVSYRGERNDLLFAYTPFFAGVFYPLSFLPINAAFLVWALISVGLFSAGFLLVWRAAQLQNHNRLGALAISLSFLPFLSFCLLAGQSTAFGFFFLALAIHLDLIRKQILSGLALSLLMYKPTLLPLLVLMILVTARWRVLAGFCLGVTILGLCSLVLVGWEGAHSYLGMLRHFSEIKANGKHPLWLDIDIYSATLMLFRDAANWVALAFTAFSIPFLTIAWRHWPLEAWGLTTLWTLVLSPYILIYDATLVVLAVVLTMGSHLRIPRIPLMLQILVILLYLAPWVTRQTSKAYGFSTLTVVLILFGIYQLFHLLGAKEKPVVHRAS